MSDIKKRAEAMDEKKKAKQEKKEKKKEAKFRKEEEKKNSNLLTPDKKPRGANRFSLFVHKDKESAAVDSFIPADSTPVPPSPPLSQHVNSLSKTRKKSGSKITNLLTRKKDNEENGSPLSSPATGRPSSPKLVGAEITTELDKQKVKMRLSRFFSSRPSKQDLVEKKILYKDFHPPSEVTIVPLRYEGIRNITQYMVAKQALNREGIFRVPGNALIVREIWRRLAENTVPDFLKEQIPKEQGPNEFAGALKLYLREAPEPAVPFAQYPRFMECLTKPDAPQKAQALKLAIRELPEENFNIMKTLFVFLKNVSNLSIRNKMDVKNIGIVFGPSVVRKEMEENGFMELRSAGFQAEIVCLMINYIVDIFGEEVVNLIKEGLDDPDVQAAIAAAQQKQAPQLPTVTTPTPPQHTSVLTMETSPPNSPTDSPRKNSNVALPTSGFANTTPLVTPAAQKRIIKIVRVPVTIPQSASSPLNPTPSSPRIITPISTINPTLVPTVNQTTFVAPTLNSTVSVAAISKQDKEPHSPPPSVKSSSVPVLFPAKPPRKKQPSTEDQTPIKKTGSRTKKGSRITDGEGSPLKRSSETPPNTFDSVEPSQTSQPTKSTKETPQKEPTSPILSDRESNQNLQDQVMEKHKENVLIKENESTDSGGSVTPRLPCDDNGNNLQLELEGSVC